MRKSLPFLVAALCGAAFTAHAPTSAETQSAKRAAGGDPNEVVCIRERELGSRLAIRRVCRTRAEWEQHHRELRLAIEKAQLDKVTTAN